MSVPAAIVGAAVGAVGSKAAADAQARAARNAQQAARRNSLMQYAINEPYRYSGYQALGDINSFLGYDTTPYTSANQLAAAQNKLTFKDVKKLMGQGLTFEQIAGMGTLSGGTKATKRLLKAGLSMDQITQLRNGAAYNASAPAGGANPGQGGGGQNFDAIWNAPDVQFQYQQGVKNIGNTFAARGGAASGNALRDLSKFNQGLASQSVDNFLNRRYQLMGYGERATGRVGDASNNYTQAFGQTQQAQGDARASGILGVTGAIQGGISGIAGAYGGGGYDPSAWRNYGNGGYSINPANYPIQPTGLPEYRGRAPSIGV